jgi:hypothetical protein
VVGSRRLQESADTVALRAGTALELYSTNVVLGMP